MAELWTPQSGIHQINIEYTPQNIFQRTFDPKAILLANGYSEEDISDVDWTEEDIYPPRPEAPDNFFEIHQSRHKFRVLFCGRRAGKTFGFGREHSIQAVTCPEKLVKKFDGHLTCPILHPELKEAKRIIWEPIKSITEPMWDRKVSPNNTDLTIKLFNGMWIHLLGCDHDPDKLRGLPFWHAWFDETGNIDENVFRKHLRASFSDKKLVDNGGGRGSFTGTPYGTNWFWKLFLRGQSDRTGQWKSWRYASFQSEHRSLLYEALAYYEYKQDQDIITWKREFYADECAHSGSIYKMFEARPGLHVRKFEIDPTWNIGISVDNGCENPTHGLVAGIDNFARVWVRHEHVARDKLVSEHSAVMNKYLHRYEPNLWHTGGEPDISVMDGTNKQLLKEYRQHGLYFKTAGNTRDTVIPGIQRVREMLQPDATGFPEIIIHPDCKILIEQMKKYRWKPRGKGNMKVGLDGNEEMNGFEHPLEVDDHGCDALRYLCMARPRPAKNERSSRVMRPIDLARAQHYDKLRSEKHESRKTVYSVNGGTA